MVLIKGASVSVSCRAVSILELQTSYWNLEISYNILDTTEGKHDLNAL